MIFWWWKGMHVHFRFNTDNFVEIIFLFLGGSLTKIAYYSTVSHRKVLYNTEKETTNTVSLYL